ncbi:hypothetical protein [Streptomyces inhibens]|uniref:hypothetical protein n=1 Tax=Streptomyces inhibens TaxID=2293571 RepID=UPI001FD4BC92|nr:hypothetical protein [Streptomyces inhibens]
MSTSRDRYGVGADRVNDDQLRVIRTLLGSLLLIRRPTDARRGLWQSEEVRPARRRRWGPDTAGRVYRHQWFVRPHRRTYPDQDDPSGYSRKWVGPYLVSPRRVRGRPPIWTP